jgi:hypothetical protein
MPRLAIGLDDPGAAPQRGTRHGGGTVSPDGGGQGRLGRKTAGSAAVAAAVVVKIMLKSRNTKRLLNGTVKLPIDFAQASCRLG